ncbi:MAG TPA: hypothetical protein VJS20_10315 [Gemmatimonadales bacterium]|nr:hypothetical protein [Gemmatimonadales bacterium]
MRGHRECRVFVQGRQKEAVSHRQILPPVRLQTLDVEPIGHHRLGRDVGDALARRRDAVSPRDQRRGVIHHREQIRPGGPVRMHHGSVLQLHDLDVEREPPTLIVMHGPLKQLVGARLRRRGVHRRACIARCPQMALQLVQSGHRDHPHVREPCHAGREQVGRDRREPRGVTHREGRDGTDGEERGTRPSAQRRDRPATRGE